MKHKLIQIFWKTYAVLYLLLAVAIIVGDLSDSKLHLIDRIDAVLSVPTVVAVIGWAWKKCVGTQTLWISYAVIFFGVDIIYNLFLDNHPRGSLMDILLGATILLLAYIGTLLYALNFTAIRQRKSQSATQITNYPNTATAQVNATTITPAPVNSTSASPTLTPWSMDAQSPVDDPQLAEIRQMQLVASSKQAMATSLAQEAQASYDNKIEAEQLGKWPWMRWYSHPVVGRDVEKGIADIIFLSLFGSSSATDKKYSKTQRAIIRVVLTLAIVALLSQISQYLLKT